MKKYKYKPDLTVEATEILNIEYLEDKGSGVLHLIKCDNGESYRLSDSETARYEPKIGDYYVKTTDDYRYLNPKNVFESKFILKD